MAIEILIVDDEEMIRWTLKESLEADGYKVIDFPRGEEFLDYFREKGGDIVFLDIRLPGISGLEILAEVHRIEPDTPVVIMTAFGDVETAITAMKGGAYDYLSKPYNLAEVSLLVKKIAQENILKNQLGRFREKIDGNYQQILGDNGKMKTLREHIARAAQSDRTTVLIRGESGTGKELVARQIHLQSNRRDKPFIDINAAAVTGTLLESELFGHEKGAFTDAQKQRKGLFELADTGTLFFDEIGDLSPSLQAKLLRVLQERRFRRVGGSVDISVDVRIIAATNADLEKAMDEGRWRRDLFYRLNVFTVFLPPLHERKDDIMLLAKNFLDQFRSEFSKDILGFHPDTIEVLKSYSYPGNVRELKNLIERAVLLESSNKIRTSSLPEELRTMARPEPPPRLIPGIPSPIMSPALVPSLKVPLPATSHHPWEQTGFAFKTYIDGVEKNLILEALAVAEGKKGVAARLLGLSRFALRHQIRKHGLDDGEDD
jgi:DNA-binding NtrC family response regulator